MTLFGHEAWELASIAEQRKLHFLMPYGWNYSEMASNAPNRRWPIYLKDAVSLLSATSCLDGMTSWDALFKWCL